MIHLSKTVCAALALPIAAMAADDRVIFNRDVRPILGEYCYHCHGPDPGSRKEGIRFDRAEGFFSNRDDAGPTVVKGQPDKMRCAQNEGIILCGEWFPHSLQSRGRAHR